MFNFEYSNVIIYFLENAVYLVNKKIQNGNDIAIDK